MLPIAKKEETKLSFPKDLRNSPVRETCPLFKVRERNKNSANKSEIHKISLTQKFILNKSFYTVITEKSCSLLSYVLIKSSKQNKHGNTKI